MRRRTGRPLPNPCPAAPNRSGDGAAALEAATGPEQRVRRTLHGRVRLAGEEGGVRVVPRLAIDVDLLCAHLDRLPLDGDHPLDEVTALAVGRRPRGREEDDDVPGTG